jgi:uncharacterized membrane protein
MKNEILASLQEAISEFREDTKTKIREWWISWIKLWIRRSLEYAALFLLFFLICYAIFDWANLFYPPYEETARGIYANNTRSMLPSLVESEAAIVAIVISLTLIAIQFTASEYSPRVVKISLKNPDMWILLLIYGISIFFGLFLLKMEPYESAIPFEDVSLALWLGVFSYVALVPYIWHITQLLNPINIVRILSEGIDKDKILTYIQDERRVIVYIPSKEKKKAMKIQFNQSWI